MWWISNACYTKQVSGVFDRMSGVMLCGSRGAAGVWKIREIVTNAGKQGK
jgi:hypothetical protein